MHLTEFKTIEDVISQYAAPEDALKDATVLLAWYGYSWYRASSFVLFEKDGKLFEVNGSHCSDYGLEGQWEPEETSWEALKMRNLTGEDEGRQEAHDKLQELVSRQISRRLCGTRTGNNP